MSKQLAEAIAGLPHSAEVTITVTVRKGDLSKAMAAVALEVSMSLSYIHESKHHTAVSASGEGGDLHGQTDRGRERVCPAHVRQILERAATDRGLNRGPGQRIGCAGSQAQRLRRAIAGGGR